VIPGGPKKGEGTSSKTSEEKEEAPSKDPKRDSPLTKTGAERKGRRSERTEA